MHRQNGGPGARAVGPGEVGEQRRSFDAPVDKISPRDDRGGCLAGRGAGAATGRQRDAQSRCRSFDPGPPCHGCTHAGSSFAADSYPVWAASATGRRARPIASPSNRTAGVRVAWARRWANRVRVADAMLGAMVMSAFAAVWCLVGISGVERVSPAVYLIPILITGVIIALAVRYQAQR